MALHLLVGVVEEFHQPRHCLKAASLWHIYTDACGYMHVDCEHACRHVHIHGNEFHIVDDSTHMVQVIPVKQMYACICKSVIHVYANVYR